MPIDPSAVGTELAPVERSWTSADAILYALGVGAGTDELAFTTENSAGVEQRVLPTFAVIAGRSGGGLSAIGRFDVTMLVHGEQAITLHGSLPAEGTVRTTGRIAAIYDKGSAAVVVVETESADPATGERRFSARSSMFIRGAGGFGGERGPSASADAVPSRDPDASVSYATSPTQALLYRLAGDRNPLHSDPSFANRAGFDRPILHGLCTYGFTGRALLHALCDGDPSRFGSMSGRFSRPVFPGDTLTVDIWRGDDGTAQFRTRTDRGDVVLDAGRFSTREP